MQNANLGRVSFMNFEKIGKAIRSIRAAGFGLALVEDELRIEGELNAAQRAWIDTHRESLKKYLEVFENPQIREVIELFEAEIVSITAVQNRNAV